MNIAGDFRDFIQSLDQTLNEAGNQSANRAFNLGCFAGLLPASVLVGLTYFAAGKSWVGALLVGVLMVLGLVLFANLSASIARHNALRRTFQTQILPEIRSEMEKYHLTPNEMEALIQTDLSSESDLRHLFESERADSIDAAIVSDEDPEIWSR